MFRRRLPPLDLPPPPEMSPAYDPTMDRRALAGMVNAPPVGPGMAAPPRQGMFGRARNWLSQQNEQGLTGADRLYAIGGALKDLDWTSGGGHFDAAMQRNDQQRAQYEQEQARRQYAEAMQQILADGQVTLPELATMPGVEIGDIMDYQKANRPDTRITAQGIFQVGPDGQVTDVERFDRPAPAGFMWDENGQLVPIPGGPADPDYIRRTWRPRESDEGDGHADSRDPWNQNW